MILLHCRMKKLVLLFILSFVFTISHAQKPFVKDSLSVSTSLGFQQKATFNDYQVTFKKLVSDSRCPKDVMCIRAGEAKVLVSISKNGHFIEDKEIVIHASGYVSESNNLAFNAEDFKVYGFALTPYPKTTEDIPEKNYTLEVVFQPKRL